MPLFAELKRRNVFRAAAAYVAVAWLVMQVAEVTFPAFGFEDRALRLLIIVLAIVFVPAVALSWAFEITPEGLKRERDLDRSSLLVARTNRLLDRGIVLLLALGLTYFAVDKFVLAPARDEARVEAALQKGRDEALEVALGDKSIVVLPFTNLSTDPEQAFLADGMAEELLNLLARIPGLRVISRTSAFAFKGKDAGIAEIADKLKVSHVLEGSVRRSGDRLRITAQLIDARTDSHLWSETYDRKLDDVFEVQDEIAAQVVDALRLELLDPTPRARRVDRQAYVLLMHARQLLDSSDDHQRIHDLLQQSIAIDPQQPDAWTTLSWLRFRCTLHDVRAHDPYCEQHTVEEANQLVIEAYERALLIDPEHAVAIAYRAAQMAFKQHQWQGAATEFERALRLGPEQTDVARSAMIFARFIRRPDAAIELGEYVLSRDPLCSLCAYQLALAYRDAGQLETAETTMRNFAAATGRGGWHTISMLRLLDGDAAGALATLEHLEDVADPWRLHGQALALHSLRRSQEALAITDELQRIAAADRPALVAEVYAWMGDLERAYPWLHKAAESRSSRNEFNAFDWTSPFLRPLLDTPRGQAVLRRFGVADEQLAAIRFEVPFPYETAAGIGDRGAAQKAPLTQSREQAQKR